MNFSKLYAVMQKWTPLSVSCIAIVIMSITVIMFLTFMDKPIPQWAIEILTVFGTILGSTGLMSHGANVANTAANNVAGETAKATAEAVVSQVIANSNGNGEAHS